MADESQVEAAIVTLLGNVLYPNGNAQTSLIGNVVNIERGWPTEADIQCSVRDGVALIRVHAVSGFSKDDTRYPRAWLDQATPVITLAVLVSGFKLTFTGEVTAGLFIGIISQDIGYTYVTTAMDTLSSIATAFAQTIPGATANGAVLTLFQGGVLPEVIITQQGDSMLEPARVSQIFAVATWAPTPALRDTVLQTIMPQLSYIFRLTLTDGSIATLMDIYTSGPDDDTSVGGEWRRDVRLQYDYPLTVIQKNLPPVTITVLNMNALNYQNV